MDMFEVEEWEDQYFYIDHPGTDLDVFDSDEEEIYEQKSEEIKLTIHKDMMEFNKNGSIQAILNIKNDMEFVFLIDRDYSFECEADETEYVDA